MNFSFSSLDLSSIEAAASVRALPPGQHVVQVVSSELKPTKAAGGVQLVLRLKGSEGSLPARLNVNLPHSAEATRIGRAELKALLVHGGHPNPDQPGDVSSLVGLEVGVVVGSEIYEGEKRSVFKAFIPASDVKPASGSPITGSSPAFNEKAPF